MQRFDGIKLCANGLLGDTGGEWETHTMEDQFVAIAVVNHRRNETHGLGQGVEQPDIGEQRRRVGEQHITIGMNTFIPTLPVKVIKGFPPCSRPMPDRA